ncbi:restriction endonuclease subunit S [Ensifer sp. ENS01]|uniref:restriction endonuclease subunit S n=1 Tax=Ensifer sp. ENS01 TaxID=2769293 RepID=UPI001786BF7A|nr:restriction endonuclease subunit S [Ensifer sp. ENS01]MBD9497313.1 restriction endonuclease subunit S [Ensifer sp. ENS01]
MELSAGYKQTEIGVIPEDWGVQHLGAMATTVASGRSKAETAAGEYPIHGSTGVIGHTHRPAYSGDAILVARVGANAGKLNIVTGQYGVTDNTIILRLGSAYELIFFWRQLESKNLNSLVFGSGQPLITGTQLKALLLSVPPVPEQRAIAAALSDADALIASLDALIAKKRDLKQATMQQLLMGKTRLPGFWGAWEVKRLGELLDYEQPTKYLVSSTEYDDAYDVPVLTAGKTFILGRTNESHGIFDDLPAIIFDDFTTASKLVNFPFKAKSSAMKILKPRSKDTNIGVVYELMQTVDFLMTDHKRYWISEYQKIEVRVPKPNEQSAIAAVLSDMDAELAALEAQRDKTRTLKQGMMQELLTGRIRLV